MRVAFTACTALALCACQGNEQPGSPQADSKAHSSAAQPVLNALAASRSAAPSVDEKGAQGATLRLRQYCALLSAGRYEEAYAFWSDKGRASGQTLDQFKAQHARYRTFDCYLGSPGGMEGAAGSVYLEIPLKVSGTLVDGGAFALRGAVTMRRVNDVPGSSDEQRRWRIQSAALQAPDGG